MLVCAFLLSISITSRADNYEAYEICGELGILQGDETGLSMSYLNKETTRLQAAILYLRLKGLEEDALSYAGYTNFVDASDVVWSGGRAIMSYLYNHPDLGWIGDDAGRFSPNSVITAKSYYKVLLEALGYKQGEDFTWQEVTGFAYDHGLGDASGYLYITNRVFSEMTVEALQTFNKNGDLYAQALVNDMVIEEDKAVELGIISFPANTYYYVEFTFSDEDQILNADGVSFTTLTATIRRRSDGAKMGVYGLMSFNITEGTLSKNTANIIDGSATVWVTSEFAYDVVIADLSVQVTDAGSYNEFLGLSGEVSITYDPNEEIEDVNYSKVSVDDVEALTCDRIIVTYTGPISASSYKATLLQQAMNIDDWETLVRAGTHAGLFIDGYRVYVEDVIQHSSNQLEFILHTDSTYEWDPLFIDQIREGWIPTVNQGYLSDNETHLLTIPVDVGGLVYASDNHVFMMQDTISPEMMVVSASSARQLTVHFSEPVAEYSVEMAARGDGTVDGLVQFSFGEPGTKDVFTIDGKRLYLTGSEVGATPDEIAYAINNNLILINSLQVVGYNEATGLDERHKVMIVLDAYSALLQGNHTLYAHNVLDWAGMSDGVNVMTPKTLSFYVNE